MFDSHIINLYFSSGSDSGDSEGDDADGLKALLALENNSYYYIKNLKVYPNYLWF